jgi:hemerythrin-like metal-binding protein
MTANIPNAAAPVIEWNDRLLLGYAEMDAEHRDFVVCVQALQQAEPAQVAERLQAFAEHARRHFGAENAWMVDTDFPARDCHIDEHAAVLKSVEEVQALVALGNTAIVRSLADELARWFPGHADYLDSALAAWMAKRRWNAKPVVLRRNILE